MKLDGFIEIVKELKDAAEEADDPIAVAVYATGSCIVAAIAILTKECEKERVVINTPPSREPYYPDRRPGTLPPPPRGTL